MSLFFDVWTNEGFVLASDVRLLWNGEQRYSHKLRYTRPNTKVTCAIAVCGDYPENCLRYFEQAIARKDSFREIAHDFATSWTNRFAGTEDYSAVHLVGFEQDPDNSEHIPQMWYWHNKAPGEDFYPEERLRGELESFSKPVPFNNHIPLRAQQDTGKGPGQTLKEERKLVIDYLSQFRPVFTWNGDNDFWASAASAVASGMKLLQPHLLQLGLQEIARLTRSCLQFLGDVSNLFPGSTVGLTVQKECDVIIVRLHSIEIVEWASWDNQSQ